MLPMVSAASFGMFPVVVCFGRRLRGFFCVSVYTPSHVSCTLVYIHRRDTMATATMGVVPNKPKTPVSTFRIPLDLKAAAKEKAKANGTDLTAVVVKALERYVKTK